MPSFISSTTSADGLMATQTVIHIYAEGVEDRKHQIEAVEELTFGPEALNVLVRLAAEGAKDREAILRLAEPLAGGDAA